MFDFMPEQPKPFSYFDSLSRFSVPNSPAGGGGDMATAPADFQFNNPYKWNPWGSGLPTDAGFGDKLGSFFGSNSETFGSIADLAGKGIGAYVGLKNLSNASSALALEKKRFRTNLANQTSSYNTQTRDRVDGRHYATQAERDAAYQAAVLPSTPDKKKKMGMGG